MGFSIEGPLLNQSSTCGTILRSLPEWFGIEKAILEYERQIDLLPTFLAMMEGGVAGFLSVKEHTPFAVEILVMAVDRQAQRAGIGRALVEAAETHAWSRGAEYMQVKTLGPSHPDENYAGTRAFYEALGFRPMEEFRGIWDESNPCLIMVKKISPGKPGEIHSGITEIPAMDYLTSLRQHVGHQALLMVGAATLIVDDRNQLLLLKRSDSGCWGPPGGAVEPGEEVEAAARREVQEETGLEIEELTLFGVFSGSALFYRYPNGDEVYNVTIVYLTHQWRGEVRLNGEHTEWRWFATADIPADISPPIKPVIAQFLQTYG